MATVSVAMHTPKTITAEPFFYDSALNGSLRDLDESIRDSWSRNERTPKSLLEMYQQSKIDELYHSNKIEGNSLTYGETLQLVLANREIRNKPLKDQREARNLSRVLDYVYRVGTDDSVNVTQNELRRIHSLLLDGIQAEAGSYRTTQTVIAGSKFAPPEAFEVTRHMTLLSDFVKHATDPDERHDSGPIHHAAAAHVWLAQIHPFTDGNGRTARALMNLTLLRRGYPPCIITEDDRPRYIDALELSWEDGDLTFVMELMCENVNEHGKNREWLRSVQARLDQIVSHEVESEYLIWRNAMTHLKSQFRHTVDNLNAIDLGSPLHLRFIDYGELGVAKYYALRSGRSAIKTRYFGIEVAGTAKRQLHVFFHAVANESLREQAQATLMLTKPLEPDDKQKDEPESAVIPEDFEVGYNMESRRFVVSFGDSPRNQNAQNIVQQFFDACLPRGMES